MKIFGLVVAVLLAVTMSVQADDCPTLEDHLQANFTVFSDAVLKATKDMEVEPVIVRLMRRMNLDEASHMVSGWDAVDPDTGIRTGVRGIDITQAFLVNPPDILRHVAAHEVCHYKLRKDGGDFHNELVTEKCVYEYEGPEQFTKVYALLYAQLDLPAPTTEQLEQAMGMEK